MSKSIFVLDIQVKSIQQQGIHNFTGGSYDCRPNKNDSEEKTDTSLESCATTFLADFGWLVGWSVGLFRGWVFFPSENRLDYHDYVILDIAYNDLKLCFQALHYRCFFFSLEILTCDLLMALKGIKRCGVLFWFLVNWTSWEGWPGTKQRFLTWYCFCQIGIPLCIGIHQPCPKWHHSLWHNGVQLKSRTGEQKKIEYW